MDKDLAWVVGEVRIRSSIIFYLGYAWIVSFSSSGCCLRSYMVEHANRKRAQLFHGPNSFDKRVYSQIV